MNDMKRLYDEKKLAIVQGVGYPNPDRSHFESMDIWQLADPKRAETSGWLARAIPGMTVKDAGVPGMFIGDERLPVAMQGADGGVISLADRASFKLQISGNEKNRKKLIEDLNAERRGQGRPRRVRPQAPDPDLHEPPEDRGGAQRRQEHRRGRAASSSTASSSRSTRTAWRTSPASSASSAG